jgi:hypothetical protein
MVENRSDTIDNLIFKEGCWLLKVYDILEPKLTMFKYMFEGSEHEVSLTDWESGIRPHLK